MASLSTIPHIFLHNGDTGRYDIMLVIKQYVFEIAKRIRETKIEIGGPGPR